MKANDSRRIEGIPWQCRNMHLLDDQQFSQNGLDLAIIPP